MILTDNDLVKTLNLLLEFFNVVGLILVVFEFSGLPHDCALILLDLFLQFLHLTLFEVSVLFEHVDVVFEVFVLLYKLALLLLHFAHLFV